MDFSRSILVGGSCQNHIHRNQTAAKPPIRHILQRCFDFGARGLDLIRREADGLASAMQGKQEAAQPDLRAIFSQRRTLASLAPTALAVRRWELPIRSIFTAKSRMRTSGRRSCSRVDFSSCNGLPMGFGGMRLVIQSRVSEPEIP
jgi:hypothetical protein